MSQFLMSEHELDLTLLRQQSQDPSAGAFVCFEGWVRNHNEGKQVAKLAYQCYESLALKEGNRIIEEACKRYSLRKAMCIHRVGEIPIGGIAVWIGVSSDHRAEAFEACRYIIDEVKLRVPIWKKEFYLDEKPSWVACHSCAHHERRI